MTQIGNSLTVLYSFQNGFQAKWMIPIKAMIQVFIFQFNLNSYNAFTIPLI